MNTRLQLGGVNENWGETTLPHIINLVKLGVLGKTVVARNPSATRARYVGAPRDPSRNSLPHAERLGVQKRGGGLEIVTKVVVHRGGAN